MHTSKTRQGIHSSIWQAGIQLSPGNQGSNLSKDYLGRQNTVTANAVPTSFSFAQLYILSMTSFNTEYPSDL